MLLDKEFVCNTNELRDAKHKKRQLERKWQNSKLTVDHQIYRNQGIVINKILHKSEQKYTSDKIQECKHDQKQGCQVGEVVNRLKKILNRLTKV